MVINFMKEWCSTIECDIRFTGNRTTFLIQHQALYYVEQHQLFECSVKNGSFDVALSEHPIKHENYNSR